MADVESQVSIEKPDGDAQVHNHDLISLEQADAAAQLVAGKDLDIDPAEAARIRRKIDLHVLPFMCLMFLLQYADKNTLGQAAVLGLLKDTKMSQDQFNLLGTIFYIFYLLSELPQNLGLQRFPVAKWLAGNISLWGVLLLCHAAAKNFGGLATCRVLLAICESTIMPGFMIVTSMFYTREEQMLRVGYWFLMDGIAIICLGFISFGCLHIEESAVAPWQWLMIIFGIITVLASVAFWFYFPDSPASAWFLTPDERVVAVGRLKANQTGVENKHFKRDQFTECIKDPKTYMWFFYAAFSQISNSLSNQRGIIVSEFGFTSLQTTLLGCVDGVILILAVFISTFLATRLKNSRAYVGALGYCVAILGAILVTTLPAHMKVGLLCSYWLGAGGSFAPFVIALAWVGMSTAGHTKRVTTNAFMIIGYALGNAVGPQPWQVKYQPRNRVPWAVIAVAWAMSGLILLLIRWHLARENRRRERAGRDETYDDVYVSGYGNEKTHMKIDKAFLDLTDIQNQDFRYVL